MAAKRKQTKAKRKTKKQTKQHNIIGWLTTDEDEIILRQQRGIAEKMRVENQEAKQDYYANFSVKTASNRFYHVEIRSLSQCINSCDCPDYQHNQLGTCKHIEKVLYQLQRKGKRKYKDADEQGSPRIEIYADTRAGMDNVSVNIQWSKRRLTRAHNLLSPYFSSDGSLLGETALAIPAIKRAIAGAPAHVRNNIRFSQHLERATAYAIQQQQKQQAKQNFIADVEQGKRSVNFLKHQLYPYQQQGMLHLAFTERALLADEMGLGKTVQAIAACELLRRQKKIQRVVIVATASLKAEWADQIDKFCAVTPFIVNGSRSKRLVQYQQPHFIYLTNYEQIMRDYDEIQRIIAPDVVILDEAQRIKNWRTKTAMAVKQLKSRYAFVLTGTPLENRIDDVYSIVQFLDPYLFGPLFRFNRDFYQLDERGKPTGYKNLDKLNQRLQPIMLRRQKSDVEGELPERTVKHYFVNMDKEQLIRYEEYEGRVGKLAQIAKRRPLLKEEFEKLQQFLACMRMLCDTPYILDQTCRISPKLKELRSILEECLAEPDNKIIIFSEWARMLELVADYCREQDLDYAWHTGSVAQQKRYQEIKRFKSDPDCRLFLSTDSGSVGLNLQTANIVINLDLPWNPAKLEQRIARAWRKHQSRSVNVINLVTEGTIEHRMIDLLKQKQTLAGSVLHGDDVTEMAMPSGRKAFMQQVDELLNDDEAVSNRTAPQLLAKQTDPLQTFCEDVLSRYQNRIDKLAVFETEDQQQTILVVVDKDDALPKQAIVDAFSNKKEQAADQLEIIDRDTMQLLQRLATSGVITINTESNRLFTASDDVEIKINPQWIKQAKQLVQKAEHQLNMAEYLLKGQFIVEAIIPLQTALYESLKAFACLKGEQKQLDNVTQIEFVEQCLIAQHGLSRQALALLTALNDNDESFDAAKCLPLIKTVYQHIQTQIHGDETMRLAA